jgi:hypothetical protein
VNLISNYFTDFLEKRKREEEFFWLKKNYLLFHALLSHFETLIDGFLSFLTII